MRLPNTAGSSAELPPGNRRAGVSSACTTESSEVTAVKGAASNSEAATNVVKLDDASRCP